MNKRQAKKQKKRTCMSYREEKIAWREYLEYEAYCQRQAKRFVLNGCKLSEEDMVLVNIGIYSVYEMIEKLKPERPKRRNRQIEKHRERYIYKNGFFLGD